MHLGDLIQVSISYTKELRKHYMKHFTRRLKQTESKRNNIIMNQLPTNTAFTFNEFNNFKLNENKINYSDQNKQIKFSQDLLSRYFKNSFKPLICALSVTVLFLVK